MSILSVEVDAWDLNLGKIQWFLPGKVCIVSQRLLKLGQEEMGLVKPRGNSLIREREAVFQVPRAKHFIFFNPWPTNYMWGISIFSTRERGGSETSNNIIPITQLRRGRAGIQTQVWPMPSPWFCHCIFHSIASEIWKRCEASLRYPPAKIFKGWKRRKCGYCHDMDSWLQRVRQ